MGLQCTLHSLSAEDTALLMAGNRDSGLRTLESCDLDKAWGALHFLISGCGDEIPDEPEAKHFLLSGEMLDDISEHAALHSPDEVAQLSALLHQSTAEEVMSAFDPPQMNKLKVYGGPWAEEGRAYIQQFVGPLLAFTREAADKGHGVLVIIC